MQYATAPVNDFDDFRRLLGGRLSRLYLENYINAERKSFVLPVGLILLIDEENGGDVTARELVKRFNLLHSESQDVIDFYFLGWEWVQGWDRTKGIRFNLKSFESCRNTLRALGVDRFGGNADLILVDAHFALRGSWIDFRKAIHVNLSSSSAEKEIPPVGEFLQSIIEAARAVRESASTQPEGGAVFSISDRLGLATEGKSFLDFIFKKLGEFIGAKKLQAIAVRNIGPKVRLRDLPLRGVSQGPSKRW